MDSPETRPPSEKPLIPREIPGLMPLLKEPNSIRPQIQPEGTALKESKKPPFVAFNASLKNGDLICWKEKPPQELIDSPQISLHVAISLEPVFNHSVPPLITSVQPAADFLGNPVTDEELTTAQYRALEHNAAILIPFLRNGGTWDMLYQINPELLPKGEQREALEKLAQQA